MAYQTTDLNILDTITDDQGNRYDVYGQMTDSPLVEPECQSQESPYDPDGFPCRCLRARCIGLTIPFNPYL